MYKVNKPDDKNQRENTYFSIQYLSIYLPFFGQGNQYFMSFKLPSKCSINIGTVKDLYSDRYLDYFKPHESL